MATISFQVWRHLGSPMQTHAGVARISLLAALEMHHGKQTCEFPFKTQIITKNLQRSCWQVGRLTAMRNVHNVIFHCQVTLPKGKNDSAKMLKLLHRVFTTVLQHMRSLGQCVHPRHSLVTTMSGHLPVSQHSNEQSESLTIGSLTGLDTEEIRCGNWRGDKIISDWQIIIPII